jgi:hypothetical protein
VGAIAALVNMEIWFSEQVSISSRTQNIEGNVLGFFVVQGLATFLIILGIFTLARRLRTAVGSYLERPSTGSIIADAIFTRNGIRVLIVASAAYAAFYLFVSSIIVYQPTVDFASIYGVTQPGWNTVACCGDYGTIPTLIVYLSPQLHLGMQLIPLDLVLAAMIPVLVGINVSVAYYALRNRPSGAGTRWFGALGAFVGLFTACPTCAGFFLASLVGGFGATTLALGLAPFQALFIAIAIPALVIGPFLTARNIRSFIYSSCKVPERPQTRRQPTGTR